MRHHWYTSFLLLLHLVHKLFSTSSLEERFEGKVANIKGMQLVDGKAGEGVGLDTSCSGGPPVTTPRSCKSTLLPVEGLFRQGPEKPLQRRSERPRLTGQGLAQGA